MITPNWNSLIAHVEYNANKAGDKKPKIYDHPGDERLLLRRLSMCRLLGETGLRAPDILKISSQHFERVQSLGIAIPNHVHYLALDPEPVLYTVVERITQGPEASQAPITPVNPALQRYYQWVQQEKPSYYLADLPADEQFAVGSPALAPSEPPRRYLVDIDPYMWPYGPQPSQQAQDRLQLIQDVLEVRPLNF